jgi:YQGE family putative transporter
MSKKAKILLLISGLFTLSLGLSNVFVNVFLWKKSNDFVLIAVYNLMHYLFSPISFILAGWLSKKKNGTWPLRVGILLFTLFFILILFLRDTVTLYAHYFGILFGLAAGFYWLAFHILSFDFTSTQNRDTFNGFNGSVVGIANAIAPFTAAFIIHRADDLVGYTIVFAISLSLFVILILVSFLLQSEHYGEHLDFKKVFRNHKKDWIHLKRAIMCWGLRDVVILFLIIILIYQTTGSELILGKFTFLAYLLSSLAYVVEQKIIKPKRRILSLHLGASFLFIAVIGLVFDINLYFLLFYIIIDALSMPFFIVPVTSAAFNIIDQSHEKEFRTEYIINRELGLNLGRTLSVTLLILLLTFFNQDHTLNYFLLFIGSAQIFALYFLKKLNVWRQ